LDDEEDTRSSHEYLNDLEEEYQARALLEKSKIFFKKGTYRFSSAKTTYQTECHKCGKKDHFARDYWSKNSVFTYQSLFQRKPLSSLQYQPELRPTKDFKAKYNKVKAKLALLSSSSSASKASMVKNKGLIAEAYEWDEEEVSSNDNEIVKVKALMILAEEIMLLAKKVLEMVNGILPSESQRNITDSLVAVTDSSATDYVSVDESSVCSIPLPLLKKLDGAEPISGPKTIKLILKSKSTFKAEALKDVTINEPSSTPAKGNKSSSALKLHPAPADLTSQDHQNASFHLAFTVVKEIPIQEILNMPSKNVKLVVVQIIPQLITMTFNGSKEFDEKRGTIFNSNKEIVMIAHRCMRTRRSYFPPTSTIPRRSRKQTTNVVKPEFRTIVEMADNRTMARMLQAPIEGYEDAIVDALNSAAGGNFLDKIPRECLSIIESKSKVTYSRSRVTDVRANTNAPLSSLSPSNSFDLQQIVASLEDKLDIRMNRFEKSLNDMKNSFVTPTAPLKAVEE
nr:hypothetical protein [Tanacetum cinerariifolium]GEY44692.1 hypothetical protein [Tanacetum cinerariifolium]